MPPMREDSSGHSRDMERQMRSGVIGSRLAIEFDEVAADQAQPLPSPHMGQQPRPFGTPPQLG